MWLPTKTRDGKSPCRLRGSSTCCVSSTHAVPSRGITTPRRTTSPASAAVWHQKRVRGHRRRQRIDEKSNCTMSTRQSTPKARITRRALTYARATQPTLAGRARKAAATATERLGGSGVRPLRIQYHGQRPNIRNAPPPTNTTRANNTTTDTTTDTTGGGGYSVRSKKEAQKLLACVSSNER